MENTNRTLHTRQGTKAIILMEDETHLYGVYEANQLYPARWDIKGYFMPQEEGKEFKTSLDLVIPEPIKIDMDKLK